MLWHRRRAPELAATPAETEPPVPDSAERSACPEADRALAVAQEHLRRTKRRTSEVHILGAALREIRRENHFAERLRAIALEGLDGGGDHADPHRS